MRTGDLHDATLLRITVDWEVGAATLELRRVGAGPVVLQASGLVSLSVPREQSWGPSVYVNSAVFTGPAQGTGPCSLLLEMQSGDEIVVVAADFSRRDD